MLQYKSVPIVGTLNLHINYWQYIHNIVSRKASQAEANVPVGVFPRPCDQGGPVGFQIKISAVIWLQVRWVNRV